MDINQLIKQAAEEAALAALASKPAPAPALDLDDITYQVRTTMQDWVLSEIASSKAADWDQIRPRVEAFLREKGQQLGETLATWKTAFAAQVEARLAEELESKREVIIKVQSPASTTTLEGPTHPALAKLVADLSIGLPICLIGPTGSGKTYAAKQAAVALGIPTENTLIKQVNRLTSPSDFLGFINAGGQYSSRKFVELIKSGQPCLICIDEMDNGNENVLMLLKGLFSGSLETPEGVVEVNQEAVRVMATMNTYGLGATREYVGRGPQDAALLNEFGKLDWEYDASFEHALAQIEHARWKSPDLAYTTRDIKTICSNLQASRETMAKEGMRVIISTRNILHIIRRVVTGRASLLDAFEMECYSHLKPEEKTRLKEKLGLLFNPRPALPSAGSASKKDPWKKVYGTEDAPF